MASDSGGTEVPLFGGNVTELRRVGNTVRRRASPWSRTVQALLKHVRSQGFFFVPEPLGFDEKGREALAYVEGEVPHDFPDWLWSEEILAAVARNMRRWHDATVGFRVSDACWGLEPREPFEVICHNDWAPYNCVFRDRQWVGIIDFDTCAPGPRLWDLAYALYRFVPLAPPAGDSLAGGEASPFTRAATKDRLQRFLAAYADGDASMGFSIEDCLRTASERLITLAEWTEKHFLHTGNQQLKGHARMYRSHAAWLELRLQDGFFRTPLTAS